MRLRILTALLILLVGCVAYKTLEDLYDEAAITGDYSRIDSREAVTDTKAQLDSMSRICREARRVLICEPRGVRTKPEDCGCGSLKDIFR